MRKITIILIALFGFAGVANAGLFDWLFPKTNNFGAPSTGSFYFANLLRFATTTTGCLNTKTTDTGITTVYASGSDCGTGGAGDITGASSLGTGLNLFDTESAGVLRFNTLSAGTNVSLSTTSNNNTIVISATGGSGAATSTNPLIFTYGVATGTASTTFAGGLYASLISAPYFHATSTSASSTLQNALFTNGQGTSLSLSGGISFASLTNSSVITNANLVNSAITINGVSTALGASVTVSSTTLLGDANTFSNAGTTTISNGLSVGTFAQTGSATSTFANGITLSGGCFKVGGSCLTSGGSGASTTLLADYNTFSGLNSFTNTGTTTFTGGVTVSGTGSAISNLYVAPTTGRLGIGTISPAYPAQFQVENAGGESIILGIRNNNGTVNTASTIRFQNSNGDTAAGAAEISAKRHASTGSDLIFRASTGAALSDILTVSAQGTSTFSSGVQATRLNLTTASSTINGLVIPTGGLQVQTLISCTGDVETDSAGNLICGTDQSGSGSVYPFTPSTYGALAVSATTSAMQAPYFITSSSTMGTLNVGSLTASSSVSFPAGSITNTMLQNSAITINGSAVSLGGSITVSSTTLLGDANTFSGLNRFITTGTTTFSGGIETPALGASQVFATSTTASSTFNKLEATTIAGKPNLTFGVTNGTLDIYAGNYNLNLVNGYFASEASGATDKAFYWDFNDDAFWFSNRSGFYSKINTSLLSANRSQYTPNWDGEFAVATSGLQVSYINSTTTATSTFQGGIQTTRINAPTATSTFGGINTNIISCTQALETDANGGIICGTDQNTGGGGGSDPFAHETNFNTTMSATSTALWARVGLYASSTSQFDYATTTALTINGNLYTAGLTGILQGKGATAVSAITDSSTAGQVLRVTGASTYGWGALDFDDTDAFTGTLPNTALENSAITINSVSTSLGGSVTVSSTTLLGDVNAFTGGATTTFTNGISMSRLNASASSTLNGLVIPTNSLTVSTLGTGLVKSTSGVFGLGANGTDYTLISATTCSGTDKVSAISASGSVTCSADVSGGGGGDDPFTHPTWGALTVSATSTGLMFPYGIMSSSTSGTLTVGNFTATSTVTLPAGSVAVASLAASTISGVTLGSNLNAHTVSGSLSGSSYNGSSAISDWALNMANSNAWTALQTFTYSTSTVGGIGNAYIGSSTQGIISAGAITATSSLTVTPLTSALILTGSGGLMAEYTGTSCTNQFVRSIDALGVATCATVSSSDVSLANLTATDSTLTFSGTYTGATARTIGLNLGNANTWTANQLFTTATSTMFSAGQAYMGSTTAGRITAGTLLATSTITLSGATTITGAVDAGASTDFEIPNGTGPTVNVTGEIAIDTTSDQLIFYGGSAKRVIPYDGSRLGFTYATSSWVGTTTLRIGPAWKAMTIAYAYCETSTGTVGVSLYDGTNRALYMATASTTINKFTYSASNNSFTAGETIRVDVGTPASSPVNISCSFVPTFDAE